MTNDAGQKPGDDRAGRPESPDATIFREAVSKRIQWESTESDRILKQLMEIAEEQQQRIEVLVTQVAVVSTQLTAVLAIMERAMEQTGL